MKKLIALLLSLTMVVCLVACGNQNNNTPSTNVGSSVSSETPPLYFVWCISLFLIIRIHSTCVVVY